jgi:hypothetical protein
VTDRVWEIADIVALVEARDVPAKRFTFDELALPDDMTMIHIPRYTAPSSAPSAGVGKWLFDRCGRRGSRAGRFTALRCQGGEVFKE